MSLPELPDERTLRAQMVEVGRRGHLRVLRADVDA